VDFGIAKEQSQTAMTGTYGAGTPSYMAPEMLKHDAKVTLAVDVYGIGMILYELLTRQIPKIPGGTSEFGNRPKIPTSIEECPSIEDCPDGYIELMKGCWNQDAKSRPNLNDVISQLSGMRRRSGLTVGNYDYSGHKNYNLKETSRSPSYQAIETKDWSLNDVSQYLEDLEFTEYIPAFRKNGITGKMLLTLTVEDFRELGVTNKLHLRNLMSLKSSASSSPKSSFSPQISRDFSQRQLGLVLDTFRRPKIGGKKKYQVIIKDALTGIEGNKGNNDSRDDAYRWSYNSLKNKLVALGLCDS